MPEFGNYQNITGVKCRSSENAKTKRMLNAEARETSKQTVGDFPGARETPQQTTGRKTRNIFNHLIKKGIYYGKRK